MSRILQEQESPRDWPLVPSFDAQEWAKEFVACVQQYPTIPSDEATMITWFASALMRGFDEAYGKRLVANSRLQVFLYILLRDYLPTGSIEKILREHVEKDTGACIFSNANLSEYCAHLVAWLEETQSKAIPSTSTLKVERETMSYPHGYCPDATIDWERLEELKLTLKQLGYNITSLQTQEAVYKAPEINLTLLQKPKLKSKASTVEPSPVDITVSEPTV